MEFEYFSVQAWKVMEFHCGHGKSGKIIVYVLYLCWMKWANLSSEQQQALQQAGNKFFQAVDAAKSSAERSFNQGVSQVRRATTSHSSEVSATTAHSATARWLRRPSSRSLPSERPEIQLRVCTWNLHGSKVDPEDDLALWLLPQGKAADLYVIGIQELIELGPMSLLLNTDGHEERQAELEQRVEEILASSGRKFLKVCSFGMVGLSLLTFVSEHLEACIGEIDCDRVKTGIEGLGGNKGGLAVRFLCGMMSMCFVNVHLPSGAHNEDDRNEHLQEVLTYAFQGISRNGSTRQPKKGFHRAGVYNALQHDLTVVFGDLNSRLDLPEGEGARPKGPPEAWLLCDELVCGRLKARQMGFREAEVTFPPTYKYIPGSDDLSPQRTPAWCDRVIFRHELHATQVAQRVLDSEAEAVRVVDYDAYPLRRSSDHRPVACALRVQLSPVPEEVD